MAERQITPFGQDTKAIRHQVETKFLGSQFTPPFGRERIDLDNKSAIQFNVFATMNPIEMEGTYPLSEAQVDRFCFKTLVYYPNLETLQDISMKVLQDYNKSFASAADKPKKKVDAEEKKGDHLLGLYFLRECRRKIFEKDKDGTFKHIKKDMIEKIANIIYFSNLQLADSARSKGFTSDPKQLEIRLNMLKKQNVKARKLINSDVFHYIDSGASPRGQENMVKAALCQAFLEGEQLVNEKHVERVIHDVLRHRIRVNIQAKTLNIDSTDVINELMEIFL